MNKMLSIVAAGAILFVSCQNAPVAEKKPTADSLLAGIPDSVPHISILDKEALDLIDSSAALDVLATGYKWTEGPVYVDDSNYLLFSDVPANRIYKWKEGSGASVYLEPAGSDGKPSDSNEPGPNGLILDKNGKLIICQQGYRRLARMNSPLSSPKPAYTAIVSSYQGKKFNSPNDAVYAKNGDLYFTDPPYGLKNGLKDSTKEIPFQGVYLVKPNGKISLFTDKVSYPNGIALSPDNKYLLVSNSDNDNKEWTKYELDKDGLAGSSSVFYHVSAEEGKVPGNPDGMKINSKGYLFASGPGGVWIFNPSGKVIAKIYTGQLTANCAFDKSEKTLYMTCNGQIMRVRLK